MKIKFGPLEGKIALPPSKSVVHRLLICSALADGCSEISGVALSDDIKATIEGLRALGCRITDMSGPGGGCECPSKSLDLKVEPDRMQISGGPISVNCRESGSTLRFLLPVAAALSKNAVFTGEGRLPQRPLSEYLRLLPQHGVKIEGEGLPLTISGRLTSGEYTIFGNVSSQYITGLLMALPLLEGDSQIRLLSPLESSAYVDITLAVLKEFSVEVLKNDDGFFVPGGQKYRPVRLCTEGDWSQAAFFMEAAALGGNVTITGLLENSAQGDRAGAEVFKSLGADIKFSGKDLLCRRGAQGRGITVDVSEIPDLAPAIAAAAAMAEGDTVITGGKRLRLKESDRISSTVNALRSMGFDAEEREDGLLVHGTGGRAPRLKAAVVDSAGDHRIAMAFSVLAAYMPFETVIKGHECVKKSYPDFYEDFKKIGGKFDVDNR